MIDETALAPPGRVVRWLEPYLKLPTDPPHIPMGGREARVFRAARGYLKYRYVKLTIASIIAVPELIGLFGGLFAWNWIIGIIVTFLAAVVFVGIVVFLVAAIRLEYDLRQYLVTDRSLRIRGGAISVVEVTITYANIQDVEISQGPLQRWFGIADLIVHTAGGSKGPKGEGGGMSHRGSLAGIDKPRELRDYILERLRNYRDSGLGDPDDPRANIKITEPGAAPVAISQAVAELNAAAVELRAAVASAGGSRN